MRTSERWQTGAVALAAALALVGCDKHDDKASAAKKSEPAADNADDDKGAADKDDNGTEQAAGAAVANNAPAKVAEAAKEPPKPTGPTWDEIRVERNKPPANLAAAPASAKTEKSGLKWQIIKPGTGKHKPTGDDLVHVWYTHWQPDGARKGTTFKIKESEPRMFEFRNMVPGWQQAIGDMVQGERRVLWIPAKLAYLSRKDAKKGPRVVDIELVRVQIAPPTPADYKKPPKDAIKTKSGLVYMVLKPGTGTAKPSARSEVQARYAGWKLKDGTCFDFTEGDETRSFKLDSVISGWTEGVQLMTEGQKNRFWIPGRLAYEGFQGKPQGALLFDVELVKIVTP